MSALYDEKATEQAGMTNCGQEGGAGQQAIALARQER